MATQGATFAPPCASWRSGRVAQGPQSRENTSSEPTHQVAATHAVDSGTVPQGLRVAYVKKLTLSDACTSKQIKLPKTAAEKFLPVLNDKESCSVEVIDEQNRTWTFTCTRYGCQYALSKIGPFSQAHGIAPDIFLVFYWDDSEVLRVTCRWELPCTLSNGLQVNPPSQNLTGRPPYGQARPRAPASRAAPSARPALAQAARVNCTSPAAFAAGSAITPRQQLQQQGQAPSSQVTPGGDHASWQHRGISPTGTAEAWGQALWAPQFNPDEEYDEQQDHIDSMMQQCRQAHPAGPLPTLSPRGLQQPMPAPYRLSAPGLYDSPGLAGHPPAPGMLPPSPFPHLGGLYLGSPGLAPLYWSWQGLPAWPAGAVCPADEPQPRLPAPHVPHSYQPHPYPGQHSVGRNMRVSQPAEVSAAGSPADALAGDGRAADLAGLGLDGLPGGSVLRPLSVNTLGAAGQYQGQYQRGEMETDGASPKPKRIKQHEAAPRGKENVHPSNCFQPEIRVASNAPGAHSAQQAREAVQARQQAARPLRNSGASGTGGAGARASPTLLSVLLPPALATTAPAWQAIRAITPPHHAASGSAGHRRASAASAMTPAFEAGLPASQPPRVPGNHLTPPWAPPGVRVPAFSDPQAAFPGWHSPVWPSPLAMHPGLWPAANMGQPEAYRQPDGAMCRGAPGAGQLSSTELSIAAAAIDDVHYGSVAAAAKALVGPAPFLSAEANRQPSGPGIGRRVAADKQAGFTDREGDVGHAGEPAKAAEGLHFDGHVAATEQCTNITALTKSTGRDEQPCSGAAVTSAGAAMHRKEPVTLHGYTQSGFLTADGSAAGAAAPVRPVPCARQPQVPAGLPVDPAHLQGFIAAWQQLQRLQAPQLQPWMRQMQPSAVLLNDLSYRQPQALDAGAVQASKVALQAIGLREGETEEEEEEQEEVEAWQQAGGELSEP